MSKNNLTGSSVNFKPIGDQISPYRSSSASISKSSSNWITSSNVIFFSSIKLDGLSSITAEIPDHPGCANC